MIEFGQKLRKKRETKGISLEEISVNTNISIKYLRAIESGDMSQLPESFMKLFMKSYANEIGVNLHLDKTPASSTVIRHQSNLFESIDDLYIGSQRNFGSKKGKKKKYENVLKVDDDKLDNVEEDTKREKSQFSDSSIFTESFDENDLSNLSIFMDDEDRKPTFEDFLNNNKTEVFIGLGIFIVMLLSLIGFYFLQEDEQAPVETPLINVITVSDNEGEISVNMRDSVYFDDENSMGLNKLYGDSIYFNLISIDTCYVIHYHDDEKIIENILLPGNKLLIKGKDLIEMKLGKIEALDFEYNGKKVKEEIFQGKKGTAFLKISKLFGPEIISKSKKIVDYLKILYGKKK